MAKSSKSLSRKRIDFFNKQGGVTTARGMETYRNFFPTNGTPLRSTINNRGNSGTGWATGKRKFVLPLQKGRSGVLRLAQDSKTKQYKEDRLSLTALPGHFRRLGNLIDEHLWMFVMAMGSHKLREFQDAFKNKKFPGRKTAWRSLSQTTKSNRRRLGLWPGKGGTLMATGRLKDSLTFIPGTRTPRAVIYPNPKAFEGAYPEWLEPKDASKIGSRSKNGSSGEPVEGMSVNGRQVWGRKGRVYATYHNEHGFSTPRRQYLGIADRITPQEESLMDDYMFFSVFSNRINVRSGGTEKMVNTANARGRESKAAMARGAENARMGLINNSTGGYATTLGTD